MDMSIDDIKNEIAELENEYKLFPSSQKKAQIDRLKKDLWSLEEKLQKDKNEFYAKLEEDNRKKDEENIKNTNRTNRRKYNK